MMIKSFKKRWPIIPLILILAVIPTRIVLGQTPNHESALVSGDTLEVLTDVVQAYQTDGDLLEAMRSLDTWDDDVLVIAMNALENDASDSELAESAATLHKELLLPDNTLQINDLLDENMITLALALSIGLIGVGGVLLMMPRKVIAHAMSQADALTQRVNEARTGANDTFSSSEDSLDDLIGSIAEIHESIDNGEVPKDDTRDDQSESDVNGANTPNENGEIASNKEDPNNPRTVTSVKLNSKEGPRVVKANKDDQRDGNSENNQVNESNAGDAKTLAQQTINKEAEKTEDNPSSSGDAPEETLQEASEKDNVAALLEDVFSEDDQNSEDLQVLDEGLEEVDLTLMVKNMFEISRQLKELDRV